jgi:hypothetical protein
MEIQRHVDDGAGQALARIQQARPGTVSAMGSVEVLRCRYCHQGHPLYELHRCDFCGARVCDRCGGTQASPTGYGECCASCARASEAWRERWHMHSRRTGSAGVAGTRQVVVD